MHAAVLIAFLVPAHAQVLYKCKDAQERITYSNVRCEEQGLKKLGEVQERVTVLPRSAPPPALKQEDKSREEKATGGVKPINPLLETSK